MRSCFVAGLFLVIAVLGCRAQSVCVNFPSNFVPLSSVAYVTAADTAGDHLVVGSLAGGLGSLSSLPTPTAANELFCDAQAQLAPQQFFPGVYVPTNAERGGNFSAFAGLLVDPITNQPFQGGVIPPSRLGAVYAFRIAAPQAPSAGRLWSNTGPMSVPRAGAVAVRLPSGKVLVCGGGATTNLVEIYDPATGVFTTRPGIYSHGSGTSATLLNDGRVLIAGGAGAATGAELYDPIADKLQSTGALNGARFAHTATLLSDGRVLMTGGSIGLAPPFTPINSSEIYDPASGKFQTTEPLTVPRSGHTAVALADGRVLVFGGLTTQLLNSAELFDPKTGKSTSTSPMQVGRQYAFGILLPNGKVVVGGGSGDATAELYDPVSSTFSFTGVMRASRIVQGSALLSSGLVLITGGQDSLGFILNSSELYNPATGLFSDTAPMSAPRQHPSYVELLDGRVLVAGGLTTFSGGSALPFLNSAEIYTPVVQGLVTSQTGLTFRAAQGSGAQPAQTVAVLSPTDTIPYTVSVQTFTGGNWLTATPSSATSVPGSTSTRLAISANAAGLGATDYYGKVTLTPTDGVHPPVAIAIVLTIVPAGAIAAPGVTPAGLVFLGRTGTSPAPQTLTIANVTSNSLPFSSSAVQGTAFFDYTPKTGTIGPGQTITLTVTPAAAALLAGVYRGSIKFSFADGSSQTVDVLLVLPATGPAGSQTIEESWFRHATTSTGCTATKLLPVLSSIGAGFSVPVAWPTPLLVQVVDDCGTAIDSGSVIASFTNGDPPLSLVNIGGGMWSATWVPQRNAARTTIRADAQTVTPTLSGTVLVSGQSSTNPKVPVVPAGGVVSSGDYIGSPAQGLLVSIFGTALADGLLTNSQTPLPTQLGSTSVSISGISVPIVFVSDSQVNVLVPYELAANSPRQLIILRGAAISVPVPITVFDNQPAILATAGNGLGQGHIYKVDSSGNQTLADSSSPAKAGDILVIYSVGLGQVNPPVQSGDPASFTQLSQITGAAAVTIGAVSAQVLFAGLTPGFAGLYQLNVVVPSGLTPGNATPVTVSVNGRSSPGAIVMAVQ
jgi:uncharacterized protein (TIGR03437 family)